MSRSTQLMLLLLLVAAACGSQSERSLLQLMLPELQSELTLHLRSVKDYDNSFVQLLLQQQQLAITLLQGEQLTEITAAVHHFFIYANVQQAQQQQQLFINGGGFYVLALTASTEPQQLLQFMANIWLQHGHSRIYYVLLLQQQLWLYNPFQQRSVQVQDSRCYQRIYANLHGYALRAYIFNSVYSFVTGDVDTEQVLSAAGPDAKAAALLAKQMNFTLNYLWPDDEFFGGRLANGSYSGGVGRAHRHELDIIFAGFFIKDYLSTRMQFSAAVYMDDLCLYVRKAQRIPQSIMPLFAVHLDVWLCFIAVGFSCGLIWLCLRGLNLRLRIERIGGAFVGKQAITMGSLVWRIFVDTWTMWVRVNVGKFPPYNAERMFLISLCLVSVIFGALLESSLATAYIRPMYYSDINTLAALDESKIPIYIKHPAFKDDLFIGHESQMYRSLHAKMLLVMEGEDRLISMVSKSGRFAGVTRSASLELNDKRYIMTKKVHMIPECPKSYHIGYVLPRPSPYLKRINVLLLQMLAAGLLDYWIGEQKERSKWSIQQYPEYLAELGAGKWKILTLSDVQIAFYALFGGCLLAAGVWLAELRLKKSLAGNSNSHN
ncbi:Ir100a [Drosophila busckii]|uniref:Ir100a n=1 Tax=Drosophila busckii TaxID=30019 RepID=A0A0M5J4Y3_DROBS|nr:uncharacterized protein LOC108601233 [Drosophila busckii]ALC46586.1 Ir100a [Drosophila busckii]